MLCLLPLTALHKALLTFVSGFEYTGLVIHLLAYDLVDQYQGTTVFDDLFLYFVPFSDSIFVPVFHVFQLPLLWQDLHWRN